MKCRSVLLIVFGPADKDFRIRSQEHVDTTSILFRVMINWNPAHRTSNKSQTTPWIGCQSVGASDRHSLILKFTPLLYRSCTQTTCTKDKQIYHDTISDVVSDLLVKILWCHV